MSYTAKDVQSLRQTTGAGMMDAKRALDECEGDIESAVKWLREKGLASAAKRESRDNAEGVVAVATAGSATALVELKCETDFVAKSDQFIAEADTLAELVAAKGEDAVAERQSALEDMKLSLRENLAVGRVVRYEPAAGAVVTSYVHAPEGRGKQGVLIELQGEGATPELGRDIAMHIAFARPQYVERDDVPAEAVDAERATLEAQTRNEGKPEQAIAKIVDGKINGYFKSICLLDQPYVKDEKQTIGQLLGSAKVNRFAQVEVGR